MSGTDAIKIDPSERRAFTKPLPMNEDINTKEYETRISHLFDAEAGTVDGEKTATGPVREEVRAQNSDSDSTSEPVPASNAAAPDVDDVGSEGTDESTEALQVSPYSSNANLPPKPRCASIPLSPHCTPAFLQLDADEAEAIAGLLLSGLVLDDGATLAKPPAPLPAPSRPRLESFDLAGVAGLIAAGQVKRIVCMCGAGISVAAGIPDFRTPGTGLYSRLAEYQLPHPEAVFDMDFFRRNPQPFFLLAKELFPGTYAPTLTHHFMRLLHDKRLLHRCYTQNIDSLEHLAGLPKEAVIAAHGNFDSARCIDCKAVHDVEYVKNAVDAQTPCFCAADKSYKKGCKGLVKPDIVFFGEGLPDRFWRSMNDDFEAADLLIVLGTSLVVQPFASLIGEVARYLHSCLKGPFLCLN